MSSRKGTVLVVGVGNELLGDEGLGVHVVRSLLAAGAPPAHVTVIEAGTSLFDVVPEMSRHSRVIIVDAIQAGGEAGTVYNVELSRDLDDALPDRPALSLHEWGVMETLVAARMLGMLPERLTLIGAEPGEISPGTSLSPALACARERIVSLLLTELA